MDDDANDLDESLLELHEARDAQGTAMATSLTSALTELDALARGMRAVARQMNQAQESVAVASMAFRAEAAAESGLHSAAGDAKALLRMISSERSGSSIVSPRRLLQSLVTKTNSIMKSSAAT